ncbi:hypothetical protein [Sphingomonas sp. DT-204]|uniref:hypothetical protein n=1 Tax=Sphingomonas sp. DT-204 TaxID=3396166 RepID=UPI003F1956A7
MSRQDMDLLLSDGINTAVYFLEKSGEFYPFGVVKTKLGEIRHIQVLAEDSRPISSSVSESLKISLRQGGSTGDYETVAIVSNVEIADRETGNKSDAISVEIDDIIVDPVLCYIPYKIEDGVLVLGDIKAGVGNRIAFAQ